MNLKIHFIGLFLMLLAIVPATMQAQNRLILQAENGVFSGTVETEHAGYTGSGFVDTENATGSYLQFEFSIKDAGETIIHIFYAHGKTDNRLAAVYLNDSLAVASLSFPPTGAFTTWVEQQTKVVLNAGTNVLRLVALTSGGLVNIDRIEVEGEQGPVQYKLNLMVTGNGTVRVSPQGPYFNEGTEVTLEAIDNEVARFDHWEGALDGTGHVGKLMMDRACTVKACFVKIKASVYYCAPDGNDLDGDGSAGHPFFNLQKAVDLVSGGDTIYMKGGVYPYSTRININTGGDEKNPIALLSVPGERAMLDFSSMADADANQGIRLTGSYWHFYRLDITGAGDNGLLIERNKPSGGSYSDVVALTDQAHHNCIEFCSFYRNRDSGIQLKNLAENNSIINCDSYYNRDSSDGDADGFAPKMTVGTGNYFYGCRAWQNSDDGWDLYLKCEEDGFPQDMLTTIENCWCWNNGFLEDGTEGDGNGNGFKLGGSSDKNQRHDVVLIRCLSFNNLQKGFDQNNNMGNMTLINCTGFATPYTSNSSHYTYRIDGTTLPEGKKLVEINNLAVWDGITSRTKSKWALCEMKGGEATTCNYQVSDSNFVSVSPVGVDAPRKEDGNLPDIDFMKIKPGNRLLIDAGTRTDGLSFWGEQPDLGCFETLATGRENLRTPEADLILFPNPCHDRVTISWNQPATGLVVLDLFDASGHKVLQKAICQGKISGGLLGLTLPNLKPGLYVLNIKTSVGIQQEKLMVR